MKRQRIRKLILITSLLLFPITLYYFSPALIINAGLNGIINSSFIVFVFLFLLSIPFGRLFCSYLCPAGGLQECVFAVNEKIPKVNGISVSSVQSYLIYYGIICLIVIPSILSEKRALCHYLCWMAPFMILGIKLRRVLHLPGIHIRTCQKESCVSCGTCNKVCPMGIDVMSEIKSGIVSNQECIQCGACIDSCPKNILTFGGMERREQQVSLIRRGIRNKFLM